MPLPVELLQAVSSPGGSRLALVLGAGCSFEAPTSIPLSRQCSVEIHRRLVLDGVLEEGDCTDPEDLSALADAVFGKHNSQRQVVERLRDSYPLKLATPNDGYLIAAALLYEGVISSIVTLNYDLALSNALSVLGAGMRVGVVERPEDLPSQRGNNLYYLHRNANAADPETWILRTAALNVEWQGHWEAIIANKVLSSPVVVFAGLGTPVSVLIESTKLLRAAIPDATMFLADPGEMATSKFFGALAVDATHFIHAGWGDLMNGLAQRVVQEQVVKLGDTSALKIREDGLENEDLAPFLVDLGRLGIVRLGKLRAQWLLCNKPYLPFDENMIGLVADLLLALATVARISGTQVVIFDDGRVEFTRDGRTVCSFIVASGQGHRSKLAIEAEVYKKCKSYLRPPTAAMIAGTSTSWTTPPTPPTDIVEGEPNRDDILKGPTATPLIHVSELRGNHALIGQMVP